MELFSDCSSRVRAAEHVYLQDGLFHVKQVFMFTWWTARLLSQANEEHHGKRTHTEHLCVRADPHRTAALSLKQASAPPTRGLRCWNRGGVVGTGAALLDR